jgi:hypothetical protein
MSTVPAKSFRRIAALLFVPLAALSVPSVAQADSIPSTVSEAASPKVDSVVNSPEAQAERSIISTPNPGTLLALKDKALAAILTRQKSLLEWSLDLTKAKGDCGQNAQAAARIAATQQGLAVLGGQIASATDVALARTLYGQIFTQWRVYLVVGPATHLPLACGAQSARATRLLTDTAAVRAAIEAARAAGADTTAATAFVNQVQPLLDQARALSSSASASAATLAPDLGNDAVQATNAATVTNAHAQIRASDALLDQVARLLQSARAALKSARHDDNASDHAVAKQAREAAKDAREQARDAAKAARDAAKQQRQGLRGKGR